MSESADQLPNLTLSAAQALANLDVILADVARGRLPERAGVSFDQATSALKVLEQTLIALDAAGLSKDTRRTLLAFDASLERANRLMDRLDGEKGVLASMQRSANTVGDVAQNAQSLSEGLDATLRDVRGAARSLQRLADALERDPDMLLKGRGEGSN